MTDSSPSGWQVLARAYRWLLAIAAILIVAWAFVWVAVREVRSSFTAGDEVELVLMHWSGGGGEEEDAIVADSIRVFDADFTDLDVQSKVKARFRKYLGRITHGLLRDRRVTALIVRQAGTPHACARVLQRVSNPKAPPLV